MPYKDFNISEVTQKFDLTLVGDNRFLPDIKPVSPNPCLLAYLQESIPLAIAMGTGKARSELIISPVIFELRKIFKKEISFFSGEEFNVDENLSLTGICDFIVSLSPEQLFIEAPVLVIIEAKKENFKDVLGQCIAQMVAAQKLNVKQDESLTVYGSITNGNIWNFLRLEEDIVTIDFTEYSISPIEELLGILVWMIEDTSN
ncbi:MAG: hypothetical protein KI793_29045 [Rivularia sp. (in: Bacteria)]|nr:hypothetical protein [Rivularia sp. MS3]